METQRLTVDRATARALYRKYREHQHWSQPVDDEIRRTYQLIAQGRVLIKAIHSIIAAGLNEEHLPKLAIVRADAPLCYWVPGAGGGEFTMDGRSWRQGRHHSRFVRIPEGSWPQVARGRWRYQAQTPLVPVHIRPKRGLQNYHILFEAEWRRAPPVDPVLVRRIGQSDLWVVMAAWDLTEIERAVLASRLNG